MASQITIHLLLSWGTYFRSITIITSGRLRWT